MPRNSDPKTIITLGDFSAHFAQDLEGRILISDAGKQFITDDLPTPTPTPTPTPSAITAAQIIAALQSEPTIIEVQDMAGNKLGYAIP